MRLKRSFKVTCQSQEKYTTRLTGNILKTLSIGSTWPGRKKKGITFWQTHLHAIIACKASSGRRLLDPLGQGTGKGTAVLANKVSRNHRS